MTKLEEKLIGLGYKKNSVEFFDNKPLIRIYLKYFKHCSIKATIYSSLIYKKLDLSSRCHLCIKIDTTRFAFQEVIDNLQQAFNVMQKDLEELKKYETL